jgi:hypothetical protein
MNIIEQHTSLQEKPWFYENNGQRIGGISETDMIALINNDTLSYGTSVWKKGVPEWIRIENTELRTYLDKIAPPPLTGDYVGNTLVWLLAFAPLIGLVIKYFLAEVMNPSNQYLIEKAATNGDYWYVTLVLTLALSYWDEKRLKKMGANTKAFSKWALLVPVYLYQRAIILKQNLVCFGVWIICFILSVAII